MSNDKRECENCGEVVSGVRVGRRGVGDTAYCHLCYVAELDHGIKHGLCSSRLRDALATLALLEDEFQGIYTPVSRAVLAAADALCDAIEAADDEPLPYCDFCHTSGHDVIDCADIDAETLAIELFERGRCGICGQNPCACEGK